VNVLELTKLRVGNRSKYCKSREIRHLHKQTSKSSCNLAPSAAPVRRESLSCGERRHGAWNQEFILFRLGVQHGVQHGLQQRDVSAPLWS